MFFHPAHVPRAKERYEEQTLRVLSVPPQPRAFDGREYLVGGNGVRLILTGEKGSRPHPNPFAPFSAFSTHPVFFGGGRGGGQAATRAARRGGGRDLEILRWPWPPLPGWRCRLVGCGTF
ncbi:uncharacterized protein LY79DRAFT_549497 [Colletotrichum navitas]|uniref:Uncharacterized protein n=1 Tax=Colletotrichum navitas TaxID=681940 RepID=A0AAD8V626_9PEZI|nr:uncharacterized protein LY79DRAFT_549497 [Colletotrichum navitas]KAK1594349.1 hypothetical protein LY79DRAFT_549497 [Colletotrichum navitas]